MHQVNVQSISISQGKRRLLENSSLSVHTGDILAITGQNGCGKSTLMKALFGTHKSDQLIWSLDSKPLGNPSPKNKLIAMLPQESFLPRDLTPSEIIAMLFKTHENQKPLFSMPYVADYSLKKLSELSHGAARYIEIVVILHLGHPFILLDEPFSLLAPLHKEAIKKLIVEKSQTKGIIVTDHYLEDLKEISSKRILMENGQLFHRKVAEDAE
jgi:ABC-type multidrug transport system ATPase subunit